MQGFQAKKRLLRVFPFPFLRTAFILRILPFHAFVTQARIEPECDPLDYTGRNNAVAKCRIKPSV